VGISPCGSITYISEAIPGYVTDNTIVRVSRSIDFLREGSALMADRLQGLRLIMPACSLVAGRGKGTASMTPQEAQNTDEIANLRIHRWRGPQWPKSKADGAFFTPHCSVGAPIWLPQSCAYSICARIGPVLPLPITASLEVGELSPRT